MRKGNRILLISVIVLSVSLAYFLLTRSKSTLRGELRNFAIEDTASVERIFIADKLGHTSLLERKGPGFWMVNNKYQARQDAINNILFTLAKLTVKAPVAKSMEENVLKDLTGPIQRKVEVYAHGRNIKTIYVGGETIDKLGTFMLLENSSVPFEVHIPGHRGFLQTRFITDERIWRDQTIFAYEKKDIREIKVNYNDAPGKSFSIVVPDRGSPVLKVQSGVQNADTLLLNQYIAQYKKLVFEYMITDETFPASRKDSILRSKPFLEISVKDRNGQIKVLKGFHRLLQGGTAAEVFPSDSPYDPERIYALVNEEDFVLVQYFQLNRLLISPESFFNVAGK